MNLKKFFNIFWVLFVIFFANVSFAQDMRLAGFSRRTLVKPVQNKISYEDVMNSYMNDMEQRIKSNWSPQQDSFKNKTVVTFQIMRDGKIKSSNVSES